MVLVDRNKISFFEKIKNTLRRSLLFVCRNIRKFKKFRDI